MLLEFSCSNHRSIKDPITFSMVANKDKTFEDELFVFDKYRVLRTAVVYGPNGSGKSNFLGAIDFMKAMVVNSINHQPGTYVNQMPHKLNSLQAPTEYSIQFVKEGVRYAYGFSIKEQLIDEEFLYYYPNNRQTVIFERKGMDITPGSKYKTAFDVSYGVLKENRLFLSCAANYTNIQELVNAFIFFKEDIVIYNKDVNNWDEYSAENLQKNPELKSTFLKMLSELGTGIKDVDINFERRKFGVSELPDGIPDAFKTFLSSEVASKMEVTVKYDNFDMDLPEESTGIRKMFEFLCPVIDIISKGKILVCDELESGLHEIVAKHIVELFKNAKGEEPAQLIFSTHDTSLLSNRLFRRDQVWFTQLNDERSTELYSLIEVRNVRKGENLELGYISGKYGAIPILSSNITDFVRGDVDG